MLPSGHLREPLDAARFADALLVTGADEEVAHVARCARTSRRRSASCRGTAPLRQGGPFGAPADGAASADPAFAGIARPERFFRALRSLGWDVARELTFRDHHWFTAQDLDDDSTRGA